MIKALLITVFIFATSVEGMAQLFAGFKAGGNATWPSFNDDAYKRFHTSSVKPGFSAGTFFIIENEKKYGLYIGASYALKGKKVKSTQNEYEVNEATYNYLDFPVLFRVKFKSQYFEWYLNGGPMISYWLGGHGKYSVYDPNYAVVNTYNYKINFNEPQFDSETLNVSGEERVQFSFAFGGGIIWPLKKADFLALDFRFDLGHTFLGKSDGASIPQIGLEDNFEYTNNVLNVSLVYMIDIYEKVKFIKRSLH